MVFAVIFAGGTGSRMQIKTPKQFLKVGGKPILIHTLLKFDNSSVVDAIVVVTLKKYIKKVEKLVFEYGLTKVCKIIEGGDTAFESQINGIKFLKTISKSNDDIVIVHDGVRPMIESKLIDECVEATRIHRNAVVISPTVETTAVIQDDGDIKQTFPREKCVIVRAPQVFYLDDIYYYHCKAIEKNMIYIDSASMFLDNGQKLHTIIGPVENIKVTTKFDYILLKKIIGRNK